MFEASGSNPLITALRAGSGPRGTAGSGISAVATPWAVTQQGGNLVMPTPRPTPGPSTTPTTPVDPDIESGVVGPDGQWVDPIYYQGGGFSTYNWQTGEWEDHPAGTPVPQRPTKGTKPPGTPAPPTTPTPTPTPAPAPAPAPSPTGPPREMPPPAPVAPQPQMGQYFDMGPTGDITSMPGSLPSGAGWKPMSVEDFYAAYAANPGAFF